MGWTERGEVMQKGRTKGRGGGVRKQGWVDSSIDAEWRQGV